jgi:hypothetical protein
VRCIFYVFYNFMLETLPTMWSSFYHVWNTWLSKLIQLVLSVDSLMTLFITHRISCLCTVAWNMSEVVHSHSDYRRSSHQRRSLWRTPHRMIPLLIRRDSVSFCTANGIFCLKRTGLFCIL